VNTTSIPGCRSGTYVLVFHARGEHSVPIGRLGSLTTQPGYYLYVGSAFGPGGLAARIARHLTPSARRHWHIDHLKTVLTPAETVYSHDPGHLEHEWAQALSRVPELSIALPHFGASDCRCASHLWFAATRTEVERAKHTLASVSKHFETRNAATMARVPMETGDAPRDYQSHPDSR